MLVTTIQELNNQINHWAVSLLPNESWKQQKTRRFCQETTFYCKKKTPNPRSVKRWQAPPFGEGGVQQRWCLTLSDQSLERDKHFRFALIDYILPEKLAIENHVVIKGNLNQSWGLLSRFQNHNFRVVQSGLSDWIGSWRELFGLEGDPCHSGAMDPFPEQAQSFSCWWLMFEKSWILVVSSGMRHHSRGCTSDSQRNPRPLDEWWINENLMQHFHAEFSCSDLKHNSHRCNGSDGRARATSSTGHERYGRLWSTLALWSCSNPDGFHAQHILFNSIRYQH